MTQLPSHPSDLDVKARRRRERRVWRRALLVSAMLHALVFLIWGYRPVPLSPFAAAGPRAGDDRAAAGSMQAMNVRTPPSRPVVPPPVPVPTLDEVEPVEFDEEPSFEDPAIAGAGPTGLEGPGIEDGEGLGDGGTSAEGLFRGVVEPTARHVVLPFGENLSDSEAEIWVFVDVRGRVVPDSTHLRPGTSDRDLDRRLIEQAAEWLFTPAQRGGEAVASWYNYRVGG